MNPPEVFSVSGGGGGGGNRPPPRKELQGPRPAVLKVNKDSYKIRKPPVPPPAQHQLPQEPAPPEDRQPVIIYAVSPKVIHTTVTDFMKLVQRLTGNTSSASSSGVAGDLSPAARIASIEQTSASPKDREIAINSSNPTGVDDIMCNILESTDVEVGPVPGILSPAPATLPPISQGFFSPAADLFTMTGYCNMFIPSPSALFSAPMVSPSTLFSAPMVSPSTLFSAPMVSPSPSACDLFNPFFDF